MWINKLRHTALAAGLALAGAGCAGENAFGDTPFGVGEVAVAGSIRGQVTANGVGVGGVVVIVTDGPRTTTDGDGTYRFARLPSARYTVSIQAPPGYRLPVGESLLRDAEVAANRIAVVNWRLERNDTPAP